MITIPKGTTHVFPENELDYNPTPHFFKVEFTHFNAFDDQPMYKLWSWNTSARFGGRWVLETSFCDRFNKVMTVEQYIGLKETNT